MCFDTKCGKKYAKRRWFVLRKYYITEAVLGANLKNNHQNRGVGA